METKFRFCIRGLIPHVERQMRMFNDIVSNRKTRSLFSGAKRWFGQVSFCLVIKGYCESQVKDIN